MDYEKRLRLMQLTSLEVTTPSRNSFFYFCKTRLSPFMEDICNKYLSPLYRKVRYPFYMDVIKPHVDFRRPDAHAGFFAVFLGLSCLAFLFSGSFLSAEKSSSVAKQATMQANLINFAGFILDLPANEPSERYKHAVRNLVLDSPEMLDTLKIQDVSFLFEKLSLSRRAGSSHMWQFSSKDCVLDIYFVHEKGQDLAQSKVEHFEIRSTSQSPLIHVFASGNTPVSENYAQSRCLKSIVREADYEGKTVSTADYLRSVPRAG